MNMVIGSGTFFHVDSLDSACTAMLSESKAPSSISFDDHVELCRFYDFEVLKKLVSSDSDPLERAGFLTSTFFILDKEVKAHYRDTLEWGRFYLDCIAADTTLSEEDRTPRADILKRMAIIYEQCDLVDHAIWICDLAAHHGIYKDGTRAGFVGRRKRLIKSGSDVMAQRTASPSSDL